MTATCSAQGYFFSYHWRLQFMVIIWWLCCCPRKQRIDLWRAIRIQERRNASYLAAILDSRLQISTPASASASIAESKDSKNTSRGPDSSSQVNALPPGGDTTQVIALPSVGDEETQDDAVRSDTRENFAKRKPARRSSRKTNLLCVLLNLAGVGSHLR